MSKIILNPDAPRGAAIKDFTYEGVEYFSTLKGETPFETGSFFQFEDDMVADGFIEHFGFLTEMDAESAKKFLAEGKQKCEKCDFETRIKSQLEKHILSHQKEQELSDLGIPMIRKKRTIAQLNHAVDDIQKQIDAEDTRDGLTEGSGLLDDKPVKNVIMS